MFPINTAKDAQNRPVLRSLTQPPKMAQLADFADCIMGVLMVQQRNLSSAGALCVIEGQLRLRLALGPTS